MRQLNSLPCWLSNTISANWILPPTPAALSDGINEKASTSLMHFKPHLTIKNSIRWCPLQYLKESDPSLDRNSTPMMNETKVNSTFGYDKLLWRLILDSFEARMPQCWIDCQKLATIEHVQHEFELFWGEGQRDTKNPNLRISLTTCLI